MPQGPEPRIDVCLPQEMPEIAALIERTFADEMDLAVSDGLVSDLSAVGDGADPDHERVLAARSGTELAGALVLRREPSAGTDGARIPWLVVSSAFRQRGLGRALLARALEDCRTLRIPLVRARSLAASAAAARLFWSFGFRVASLAPVTLGGRPRESILFEKRLAPPPASA